MGAWITQLINSGQTGILVLIGAFIMGMISVVTCACNFAVFAMVAGYSGSSGTAGKPKGLFFAGIALLVGSVLAMAIIGALFGYAGEKMGAGFGMVWDIAAGVICIFFGLMSMDFLPFSLPSVKIKGEGANRGLFSAILFGLIVGGVSTASNTCCNPMFPIILAASFVKGSMIWGLSMLTVFALGYALPLSLAFTGLRFGAGKLGSSVSWVGNAIKYVGGILLVVIGFYFLLRIK